MSSQDNWILAFFGKSFQRKELEDDLGFKARHPSNKFIIHSVVACDGVKKRFIPVLIRYTRKSLRFLRYSVDVLCDYELAPSLSFHPKSSDRDRFYSNERFANVCSTYEWAHFE